MSTTWDILLIVAGLVGSVFFAAMETGLISINRVRLCHWVERGDRRARILNRFLEDYDRMLGTILVGNNLANVLIAVGAAALTARFFGAGWATELVTTLAVAGVVLVLGEIAPKTLAHRYPHRLCLSGADLLAGAGWLLAPVVVVLSVLMQAIARIGRPAAPAEKFFVTRETLKLLAQEGAATGNLTPEEREMILAVFDFTFKTAAEVMVPLSQVVTVGPSTSVTDLLATVARSGCARLPVCEEGRVVGVVNAYELLFENVGRDGGAWPPFIRRPCEVLAAARIDQVLRRLRAARSPLGVVIDQAGHAVGIITIEDIVEEIVGEIED